VKNEKDIIPAINLCIKESKEVLAEEFIQGRELTVAVLDGQALPIVEIVPKNELYDYEAKYTKGKSEYIAPAVVDAEIAKAIQDDAVKAYNVIGASGLARIDFMLTSSGQYYCLEVNTLPGMTNLSLAPMAAKVAGVSFDQLITKIIESALKK
jgi:D-alanine-D-alanine ligase